MSASVVLPDPPAAAPSSSLLAASASSTSNRTPSPYYATAQTTASAFSPSPGGSAYVQQQPLFSGDSGISGGGEHHSRSASFPLASSPSPARQLPPGAAYAPDQVHQQQQHRTAPSLPLNLDYAASGRGASLPSTTTAGYGEEGRQASLGRTATNGALQTVAEGGGGSSSAGGGAASGSSPERRPAGGRGGEAENPAAAMQQQGQQGQQRRPMLLPELPKQEPLSQKGGWDALQPSTSASAPSSSHQQQQAAAHPSRPPLPSQASSPAMLPPQQQHPPQAYYSPAASSSSPAAISASPASPSAAPAPPPLHQRSSFTGIPGGRLLAQSQGQGTRAAADAAERASNIPAFVPAAAFSPADRGPYPPHLVSPTRPSRSGGANASSSSVGGAYASSSVAAFAAQSPAPPPPQAAALSPPPPSQPSQPTQPAQLPPHLTPQPEICVECMMRDRDMADVDVTGLGVWERESDAEWEEQVRWEGENPLLGGASGESSGEHGGAGGSQESGTLGNGAGTRARRASGAASFSRESVGGRSSNANHGGAGGAGGGRKRYGRGQALSSGNLKVLTSMNPPAAAHRWRTLQTYLATQIHLIELERQAREATAAAAQREEAARAAEVSRPRSFTSTSQRDRSSSLLSPASLAAEKAALEHEERHARLALKAVKTRSRATLADETNRYSSASLLPPSTSPVPINIGSPQPPLASSSAASIRSYSAGDQPWLGNQLRRFSSPGQGGGSGGGKDASPPKSPAASTSSARTGFGFGKFARSTTDLRSTSSPRSVSPARTSVGGLDDGRRTSMWSRFRQSASASVLSFAPSGSMMDMHLGLSQDKHHMPYAHGYGYGYGHSLHGQGYGGYPGGGGGAGGAHHAAYETYPSMSDPAVARHAEQLERERVLAASSGSGGDGAGGKKKKKGIKGFFNKLVGGGAGGKKGQMASVSAPATPGADVAYGPEGGGGGPYDDDELAPPPPLSALVNEPRYHQRSASNSSVDSFGPYTPPLHPGTFRPASASYAGGEPAGGGGPYRAGPADRQSILTMGSYTSRRSQPGSGAAAGPANTNGGGGGGRATIASRNSVGRPSLDSLRDPTLAGSLPRLGSPEPVIVDNQGEPEVLVDDETGGPSPISPLTPLEHAAYAQHHHLHQQHQHQQQPRLQKSLPSLPSEAMCYPSSRRPSHEQQQQHLDQHDPAAFAFSSSPNMLPPPNLPYAHYTASRSAQSLAQVPSRNGGGGYFVDDAEDERKSASVGRKSRSRTKVFSMNFGGFGNKKSKNNLRAAAAAAAADEVPPVPSPAPFVYHTGGRGNSLDSAVALGYAGGGGGEYDARDGASSFRYVR
ncbi:hypothetical protein JCM6882_003639 [Rhodosporidiobolus microsporus]